MVVKSCPLNAAQVERVNLRAMLSGSKRGFLVLFFVVAEALSTPPGPDGRASPVKRSVLLGLANNLIPKFSLNSLHKLLHRFEKASLVELEHSDVRATAGLIAEVRSLGSSQFTGSPVVDSNSAQAGEFNTQQTGDKSIDRAKTVNTELEVAKKLIVDGLALATSRQQAEILADLAAAAVEPVDEVLSAAAGVLCAIRRGRPIRDLAGAVQGVLLGTSDIKKRNANSFAAFEKDRVDALVASVRAEKALSAWNAENRAREETQRLREAALVAAKKIANDILEQMKAQQTERPECPVLQMYPEGPPKAA